MDENRVMLLGATGTIGRATYRVLVEEGYVPIAPVRQGSNTHHIAPEHLRFARAGETLAREPVTAVISCIASRSGLDAWEVDYALNSQALVAAIEACVPRFVLLSAICVQKPRLKFQFAKLAFEDELQASPLKWSIVRPTAFFKSLSGQARRLKQGKPFLLFGDGELTSCKPISDRDAARYLVACLRDRKTENRVLPIGGPGPALTPHEQGELLFEALGVAPRFSSVPVGLMSAIAAALAPFKLVSKRAREKSELAQIGHYYATESMLVWDADHGRYDADATPEFGSDRLADHYRALAAGELEDDLGAHSVF
ncbi:MAG: NAD(P)H-binding protein [Pseudomonadota bacterium]